MCQQVIVNASTVLSFSFYMNGTKASETSRTENLPIAQNSSGSVNWSARLMRKLTAPELLAPFIKQLRDVNITSLMA